MKYTICATPACALPRRHRPGCNSEACRGCRPARAADGSKLCRLHTSRLAPDAIDAALVWAELALNLTGGGGGRYSEIRTSNPQPGLSINEKIAEHRQTIRNTLVSWTKLISDDRRIELPWRYVLISLPPGVYGPHKRVRTINHRTIALGRFIATHALWLAQQAPEISGAASTELADLVRTGRALQQPSDTRIVEIGPCPQTTSEGICNGSLRGLIRPTDSLLPSAVTCDANDAHTWDSTQWTKLGRVVNDRRAA